MSSEKNDENEGAPRIWQKLLRERNRVSEGDIYEAYENALWGALHRISYMGDNDEAISKHIIHSLTSICIGLTWEENLDYKTGSLTNAQMEKIELAGTGGIDTNIMVPGGLWDKFEEENKQKLGVEWDFVKALADEIGLYEFYSILKMPRFSHQWTWERIPMYARDHQRHNKTEIPSWILRDLED